MPSRKDDSADSARCPYGAVAAAGTDRRVFVQHLLAVALGVPAAAVLGACGDDRSSRMDDMSGWMMDESPMDGRMMRDMRVIRDLLADHAEIRRRVDHVPGGVRTVTTSSNPQVAEHLQTHVRQMEQRLGDGDVIRQMDPLFREIFEHHTAIRLEIDNIDHGVQVTETSEDAQVALLIRQHARRAVSEFVDDGMARAMRPTPLPEGYRP